jgi:hypothetical protein
MPLWRLHLINVCACVRVCVRERVCITRIVTCNSHSWACIIFEYIRYDASDRRAIRMFNPRTALSNSKLAQSDPNQHEAVRSLL